MSYLNGVTLNGEPLDDYLGKLTSADILDVREQEIRSKRWKSPASGTRHKKSLSGARSTAGSVIYDCNQRATHVLVCGEQFLWSTKAPFVASGTSVLGAIELDSRTGEVKCHECDYWGHAVGHHVRRAHGLTVKEYLVKHGLRAETALTSPQQKERLRKKLMPALKKAQAVSPAMGRPIHRGNTSGAINVKNAHSRSLRGLGFTRTPESDNLRGKCLAQRKKALLDYCESLGRTPTRAELFSFTDSNGQHILRPDRLKNLFGMPMGQIIASIGRTPRIPYERRG